MTASEKQEENASAIYREAEININRDNINYLLILGIACIICDILNEVKIFSVAPIVMRVGMALGMLSCLIPSIVLSKQLNLIYRKSTISVYRGWHKYFILAFAWLGTAILCIMLTHHTIIVMAVPIIMTAQYRWTKTLLFLTVILASLCALLGLYGGYFLGCFDANLLHIALTKDNAFDLSFRLAQASPNRMYQLLTHYFIPREIIVLSIIYLATKISRRNNEMLDHQVKYQAMAQNEMRKKNNIQIEIIDGMANLIENRDTSTGEHVKRTSFYVQSIVTQLQTGSAYAHELPEEQADTIVRAAPLHDIGKIAVADRILQKPGKLTPDEYEEIKYHAYLGARVIKNVLGNVEDEGFLRAATDIAGGHHERWDGKGYPKGLSGENIPLSARIMAVADVFDALVSKRVYKEPMSPEEAFDVIANEAGKQFDPVVVEAFLNRRKEITDYLGS